MAVNERFDFTGKSIIVTGGGKGIGKVYVEEFAKVGARVVAADIEADAAKAVAGSLSAAGHEALGLGVDVASEPATAAMAQSTLDRFGAIDVLVNNASLMSVLPRRSWLEIPVEEWDRVMAVNLRGMFLCCRAVFPAMAAQKRGKIVNISSSRVWEGAPNRLHYTTSKAGVIGLTCALSREVGEFGITVNALTPRHHPERDPGRLVVGQLSRHPHRRPRHRARPGAGRSGRRRDVPVVVGERFHDRPDHQCGRRQVDALIRSAFPGRSAAP
jgi:3-oxoacyl-[acyl-carrier protein] reductase